METLLGKIWQNLAPSPSSRFHRPTPHGPLRASAYCVLPSVTDCFCNRRNSSRMLPNAHFFEEQDVNGRQQLDELSAEIFDIFTNPSRSMMSSAHQSSQLSRFEMNPPSRNSNPLVKDHLFSVSPDQDSIASSLNHAVSFHNRGQYSPISIESSS